MRIILIEKVFGEKAFPIRPMTYRERSEIMKVIILAAGQGTRLRPLTDHQPKCMVEINHKRIIDRQIEVMKACGIKEEDIYIVGGYRSDVLADHFKDSRIQIIHNQEYETTNMVCSLMCAKSQIESSDDVLVSYGDIIYNETVLNEILKSGKAISVIVDDGWYGYWRARMENPLEDAETLVINGEGCLEEIGQKTDDISRIQAQYIGLMRFRNTGVADLLKYCALAKKKSSDGEILWRTERPYRKMYMTDLLQGMIDEGVRLSAVHIDRGWFEVDCAEDLKVAEKCAKIC